MRCDALPASSFRPALFLALVWIAGGASSAKAQSDRVAQLVERTIADLEQPERAADAAMRLENLGALAVPALRSMLQYEHRERWHESTRLQAIAILGNMGKFALPALPELREYLRTDSRALGQDATAALAQLAPHFDDGQCRAILADFDAAPRQTAYWLQSVILRHAATVGSKPEPEQLLAGLAGHDAGVIATCRWLAAHPDAWPEARPQLLAALDEWLERAGRREALRWRGALPGHFAAGDVAAARLALAREPMNANSARALLDHTRPEWRRRAIAWVADHGTELPFRQRADLVGRLWDVEPSLVIATANAWCKLGRAGLVALPALRLMQQSAPPEVAAACAEAAAAVMGACASQPSADRAWLVAVDRTLAGEPATTPAAFCTAEGQASLVEVLWLAQWNDASTLDRLLGLVENAGPCSDEAMQAVLGWLDRDDTHVVDVACAWLARRGAAVHRALGEGAEEHAEEQLRSRIRFYIPDGSKGAGIELLAHATVAGAAATERAFLLDDDNLRIVAHALATALAQGQGALRGFVPRLQTLLSTTSDSLLLRSGQWDRGLELPVDVAKQVRTLAAIALVDADAVFQPPPDLDDAVRLTIGVPLGDLDRHVSELRAANRLPALLDRLEDQCRHALGVPPQLRWPSLAGTTR